MRGPRKLAHDEHYYVAIGASAGGLEAIHEFFDHMPVSANLSFIIIQHLSTEHKSLLVELLAKHTNMQIEEPDHGMKVEKGHIYVIPNNKLLKIEKGNLMLSERSSQKAPNTAINTFFTSLAKDKKDKAIAVILSGTGTDGTQGATSIKQEGGLVFVQDPLSAKFDGMPNSAIAAGIADYILSPELIPEEIFNAIHEEPKRKGGKDGLDESKLPQVLELLQDHCGYDFTNYKTPTILRRIARRIDQLEKQNFDEYFEYLNENEEECRILGKEFLIGVTKFFRDQPVFDVLENEVLPKLTSIKENGDPIKAWVTACSTGQEAYSLAILLDKYLRHTRKHIDVKIFASDIDREAIEVASRGSYPKTTVDELDSETVKEYFVAEGDQIMIIPRIRKQIVFTAHNILKDPPFIKNDIVTCRNMLIYMNPILQEKVFNTLQFSLKTKGFLVLGPSEVPHSIKSSLQEVDGKWKVYKKISSVANYDPERFTNYQVKTKTTNKISLPLKESTIIRSLTDDLKDILAEERGYAALYIDKDYEIKAAIGNVRKYLSLPDNIINFNILKMVNTDLSVVLSTAIRKAANSTKNISINNARIKLSNTDHFINIIVKPSTANTYTTIVINEIGSETIKQKTKVISNSDEQQRYVLQLEEDLRETKLSLQTAVENLETANEELQSSNEELLSSNEELQSSNEELQSLNEELHTLNTEHQVRIKELIELNDDLNNYFSSTKIGQVFLDRDLRVRKFSPSVESVINLRDSDIGRPLDHIATNIVNDEFLMEELKTVLRNEKQYEKEVQLRNGTVYLLRILPYVKRDKVNDGLVMTFVDITANKELDTIVKGVFNASMNSLMTMKAQRNNKRAIVDFVFTAANHAADQFLGMGSVEYTGKSVKQLTPQLFEDGFFERCRAVVEEKEYEHFEMIFNLPKPTWFDVVITRMMDGVVVNLTNIDEKKEAEERLKTNYYELVKARDSIKKLNSELEQKVEERTAQLTESEERFRLVASTSSDAIWDWDLVNNTIWWSDSFLALFGFRQEDVGKDSQFWLSHVHDEDVETVRRSIGEVLNGDKKNWIATYRFRRADGSFAHILNKSYVLQNEYGTPFRILSSMLDISEMVAANERLEEKNNELKDLINEYTFVTDFMPDILWSATPDGHFDFFNHQWYEYTGCSPNNNSGLMHESVLHQDDVKTAIGLWQHSLETGEPLETGYRIKSRNGEYRWFLSRAVPMKDEKGAILKWFGTCTDVHDHKQASDLLEKKVAERTKQLRESNRKLEERNHELLQFTSVTSHDLKEPLRKIHVFGNLIRNHYKSELSENVKGYVDKIVKASFRMTQLIEDLLCYSRTDYEEGYEWVDLEASVREVMRDLELTIREKNASLEILNLESIECNPIQFQRIFQNLISNSLKFARKDVAPRITITGEALSSSGEGEKDLFRIKFRDNGIGFKREYADKIFEVFQRLHTKDKYDGTGIGLAIVKKIVEKHGGTITADGAENDGAVFVITVPRKQRS